MRCKPAVSCPMPDLPLRNNCVDGIVCDLPFGVNHCTVEEVRRLYPRCVDSFKRFVAAVSLLNFAFIKLRYALVD